MVRVWWAATALLIICVAVVWAGTAAAASEAWVAVKVRGDVRLYAAQVLHQLGHFREALALLEGGELPPGLTAAAEEERRRIREALGESAQAPP